MKIEFQYTDASASNQEALAVLNQVMKFSFIRKFAVLAPYVKYLKGKLPKESEICLSSIIDFPFGIMPSGLRKQQIEQSAKDGANSIELIMPSYFINNRQNAKIKKDIEICYDICSEYGVSLHYILEYRAYNYSCLSRLIKFLLNFNLNDVYISTGHKIDDIYDHIIAIAMISKENPDSNIICNANVFAKEHIDLLKNANLTHYRVNNLNILSTIQENY